MTDKNPTHKIQRHQSDVLTRFLGKVDKTDSCWLWTACTIGHGYGYFGIGGKMKYAHRLSYEWFKGDIPEGLCVLHKCDVPACVNPDHLFIGTQSENCSDMLNKKRHSHGPAHYGSKLTEDDVLNIRKFSGRYKDIANVFGVSASAVGKIKRRQMWKHLP